MGKTPEGKIIDHINRDKGDAQLSNLRFATLSENVINRSWDGHGSGQKKAVIRYTLNNEFLDEWPSAKDAVASLGEFNASAIQICCQGKTSNSGGYLWKYKEDTPLKDEVWKTIKGVDVSNRGRTRDSRNIYSYGTLTINGYRGTGCGGKSHLIHRLICEAFNGKSPEGKNIVDHKDGNKENNRSDNLEWVSHQENMERASGRKIIRTKDGVDEVLPSLSSACRVSGRDPEAILRWCRCEEIQDNYKWRFASEEDSRGRSNSTNAKEVIQYPLDGKKIRTFRTMREACIEMEMSRTTLRKYMKSGDPYKNFIYK